MTRRSLRGGVSSTFEDAPEALATFVSIVVMLLAVLDVALRDDRLIRLVETDDRLVWEVLLEGVERVVGMDSFHGDPEAIITLSVVSEGPLAEKVVGLTLGPAVPVFLVGLAVVANASEAMHRHRPARELARDASLDPGDRDQHFLEDGYPSWS